VRDIEFGDREKWIPASAGMTLNLILSSLSELLGRICKPMSFSRKRESNFQPYVILAEAGIQFPPYVILSEAGIQFSTLCHSCGSGNPISSLCHSRGSGNPFSLRELKDNEKLLCVYTG